MRFFLYKIIILTLLIVGCAKEDNLADSNVYRWKIEHYSKVSPSNGLQNTNNYSSKWLIGVEYVSLTNARIADRKKVNKVDGVVDFYVYTRIKAS